MNKTPFVTPYISMEINNGILYFTYLTGVTITINVAKEIVKQRLEYTNEVPYPLLVTYEGLRNMDKPSRDYLVGTEGLKCVLAGALVIDSSYTKFLGNMFLTITKLALSKSVPSKLFTDKQEALKWLEQYKPKS